LDNTQQCTNSIYFSIRELLFDQTPRAVQVPGSSLLAIIIEEEGIEEAIEYFWKISEVRVLRAISVSRSLFNSAIFIWREIIQKLPFKFLSWLVPYTLAVQLFVTD